MKKSCFLGLLGIAGAFGTQAQEFGRVLSTTPVIAQVAVPRQVCSPQPVAVAPPTSGAGSVIGAVAGGILGSTIGGGMGQAAATALGTVGGALVGNQLEAGNRGYAAPAAAACRTETTYENRTVGYNVSYEWGGRNYTVQMPYDPGPSIALQVTPVGALGGGAPADPGTTVSAPSAGIPILRSFEGAYPPAPLAGSTDGPHYPLASAQPHAPAVPAYPAAVTYPAPVVYPAPLYYGAPVYPAYGVRPYYPPIGISLNFGWSRGFSHRHGGHHHGRHSHWR